MSFERRIVYETNIALSDFHLPFSEELCELTQMMKHWLVKAIVEIQINGCKEKDMSTSLRFMRETSQASLKENLKKLHAVFEIDIE